MGKFRRVGAIVLAVTGMSATAAHAAEPGIEPAAGDTERLFGTLCGGCHPDGGRKAGRGPALTATALDAAALRTLIQNGIPGKHPAYGRRLEPERIAALADYVQTLKGR